MYVMPINVDELAKTFLELENYRIYCKDKDGCEYRIDSILIRADVNNPSKELIYYTAIPCFETDKGAFLWIPIDIVTEYTIGESDTKKSPISTEDLNLLGQLIGIIKNYNPNLVLPLFRLFVFINGILEDSSEMPFYLSYNPDFKLEEYVSDVNKDYYYRICPLHQFKRFLGYSTPDNYPSIRSTDLLEFVSLPE